MDLLGGYGSGSDEGGETQQTSILSMQSLRERMKVNAAPIVKLEEKVHRRVIDPTKTQITYNAPVEEMWAPTTGPTAPWLGKSILPGQRNTLNGFVEDANVDSYAFDRMHNMFTSDGMTYDPDSGELLIRKPTLKRKIEHVQEPQETIGPVATKKDDIVEEEEEEEEPEHGKEEEKPTETAAKRQRIEWAPKSIFHGGERIDYLGRSWVTPPSHLKPSLDHECFIPKKVIHTCKGVSAIQFFPDYGHLILSSSMDSTVKIWEVYGKRRCMQTYKCHEAAVRDTCFSRKGERIATASFDKFSRVMDTETGQLLASFQPQPANPLYPPKGGLFPSCVKFNPLDNNEILVGCSDKRVLQYDLRSNQVTQEYDRHLESISTITFISDTRFVTTSDDKKIYVWDYGIGVETSYVADPSMHAIQAASLSPDGKWLLCQSMDNAIHTYSAEDKFRQNHRKIFKGHNSAGHACKPHMSIDGKWVVSGSSGGELVFWDWKTKRIFSRMKEHKRVAIQVEWHPIEGSKVASCSWDGTIKLWD